jgi:hypothetical protein
MLVNISVIFNRNPLGEKEIKKIAKITPMSYLSQAKPGCNLPLIL